MDEDHLQAAVLSLVLVLLLSLPAHATEIKTPDRPASSAAEQPSTSTLIYVSDYFSFVGADDTGHVAFALDNNRGRDTTSRPIF